MDRDGGVSIRTRKGNASRTSWTGLLSISRLLLIIHCTDMRGVYKYDIWLENKLMKIFGKVLLCIALQNNCAAIFSLAAGLPKLLTNFSRGLSSSLLLRI